MQLTSRQASIYVLDQKYLLATRIDKQILEQINNL